MDTIKDLKKRIKTCESALTLPKMFKKDRLMYEKRLRKLKVELEQEQNKLKE